MKLVTYQYHGETRTGAVVNDDVVDLNRAYRATTAANGPASEAFIADARVPSDMLALLNGGQLSLDAARQAIDFAQTMDPTIAHGQGILRQVKAVTILAPIQRPGKVICLGLNYKAHAEEAGMEVPKYPILFHKVATSVIGPGENIVKPRICDVLDYEVELAVVIGKRGKHIAEDEALSYVAGYACANDVSARDLQFRTNQWTMGKMMDASCPLGPYLVTTDEIPDPNALQVKTILNGDVMQDSNTADMIFHVSFTISYISQISTLEPGDVILTGTPEGIGATRKPPVLLNHGDQVTVEIEGLGSLTNSVIDD